MKKINISQPKIGLREYIAVYKVLRSGILTQGPNLQLFEEGFSRYLGEGEVVAVNSGTSALHLALVALQIGPGDDVLVPTFSFAASANAIRLAGANPIFVDSDEKTFNIDTKQLELKVTKSTKAIMAVHIFGLPANMSEIMNFAKKHRLKVIEDAAQAHGSKINKKMVGTWGDAACFSFYPTKNITTAEGGAIIFKDSGPARTARMLRNQGMEKRYQNEMIGFNLRMNEIQAAMGVCQIARLDKLNQKRIENAALYLNLLSRDDLAFQELDQGYEHVYHQFTIRIKSSLRDSLKQRLEDAGIGCGIYYPTPIHRLKPYVSESDSYPVADSLASQVLSLPVHPGVSSRDVKRIASEINRFLKEMSDTND